MYFVIQRNILISKIMGRKFKIIFLAIFFLTFFIGEAAFASFNDNENSTDNIYSAGTLDFLLTNNGDFSPEVTPIQPTIRNISVVDDSSLDFQYQVYASEFSGNMDLCNALQLTANLDGGLPEYTGDLTSFAYNAGQFSAPEDWEFTATLTSDDPGLENQVCTFDFIFDGEQISGAGFYDQEMISNTITSGQWSLCNFVINEVYYDPDDAHQGKPCEEKFEWIEFYNDCDEIINLQNWYIEDNSGQREIIHQSYPIGPGQFVVVAANAAVWKTYWTLIPANAVKIALGGNMMFDGLDNAGDRVVLYDNNDNQRDAVSWETDTSALDPPVPDVPEGYSIARIEKGVDTDTAADWEGLPIPNPGTNPHSAPPEELSLLKGLGEDKEEEAGGEDEDEGADEGAGSGDADGDVGADADADTGEDGAVDGDTNDNAGDVGDDDAPATKEDSDGDSGDDEEKGKDEDGDEDEDGKGEDEGEKNSDKPVDGIQPPE